MNARTSKLAAVFLLSGLCGGVRAASFSKSARGTTGAQFLELPTSARAAAMGEAQGAAVNGASALDYNPAALSSIAGGDAVFMHAEHIEGISYDSLAAAQRLGDAGTLGLGLRSLSPGTLQEVDNTGALTGGSLSPRDMAVALGYGRAWDNFDLGVAGKYISSKIDSTAKALAVDLGTRYRNGQWMVSAGVANAGQGIKFRDRSDSLPLTARLGSAYAWKRLTLALDLVAPRGSAPFPAVGAEYRHTLTEQFACSGRMGYNGRFSQSRLGTMTGITFGVGVEVSRLRFDYAAASYGDLGLTHRLSAGLRWGSAPAGKTSVTHAKAANAENSEFARALSLSEDLIGRGGFTQAETVLENAFRSLAGEDDHRVLYYEARGRISRLRGDCTSAKSHYSDGLALATNGGVSGAGVAGCLAGIGFCLHDEKKSAEAASYLTKALEANPPDEMRRQIEARLSALRKVSGTGKQ